MAYDNIYQFSTTPITEDDYIKEYQFYEDDTFVGEVATHVDGDVNLADCLDTLKKKLKDFPVKWVTDTQLVFLDGFKATYFASAYKQFKRHTNDITLKQFLDPLFTYKLRMLLEHKYDMYVYLEPNRAWLNFDQFVRDELQENQTYYVGNVIGYHY